MLPTCAPITEVPSKYRGLIDWRALGMARSRALHKSFFPFFISVDKVTMFFSPFMEKKIIYFLPRYIWEKNSRNERVQLINQGWINQFVRICVEWLRGAASLFKSGLRIPPDPGLFGRIRILKKGRIRICILKKK